MRPGDANIDSSADCQFAATDNNPTKFVRVVRAGVESPDQSQKQIELYLDGRADVTTGLGERLPHLDLSQVTGNNRKFNLRMTIVGDRFEFTLDG